jgi:Ser/Thr protein kinase RdoA (MazF antagonist)
MRYGLLQSNRGNFVDRSSFPAQSSVLDEVALLHRVVYDYGLPTPRYCIFLERGDADVYRIHTIGPAFYLKVYRPPHPMEQAEAEARLVAKLLQHGASVVAAVPRRDGAYATEVTASEGPRPALVFEEAPPLVFDTGDENACRRLGEAVARLHAAGDAVDPESAGAFASSDLLPFARRLAYEEDYAGLQSLRQELRERLGELTDHAGEDDVGWCHGDLVLSNIRCRKDGSIVFFDFGNAGFIPRANELARIRGSLWKHQAPKRSDVMWAAFVDGYAQVRVMPEIAEHSDRLLMIEALRRIDWIGGVMASCPLRMGTETFNPEWVRAQLRSVRQSVAQILENPTEMPNTESRRCGDPNA